jgi:hypothetical protein
MDLDGWGRRRQPWRKEKKYAGTHLYRKVLEERRLLLFSHNTCLNFLIK